MPKPTLADKLKSLGVKVGTSEIMPPADQTGCGGSLESALDGHWVDTPLGRDALVHEAHYPLEYRHGIAPLFSPAPLHNLASWAGDARLREMPLGQLAFLDTETSGLAGGTGTYAFLVGIGRFEKTDSGEDFHLAQFFMRDPAEEPALLAAIERFPCPLRCTGHLQRQSLRRTLCSPPATACTRCPCPLRISPTWTCCRSPAGCGATASPPAR